MLQLSDVMRSELTLLISFITKLDKVTTNMGIGGHENYLSLRLF